jgi:hypothetical protein
MRRILVVVAVVLAGVMVVSAVGFSEGYAWWHLIGLIGSLLLLAVAAVWPRAATTKAPPG